MKTVAIANQKGGVGKTTTAVNLGAGLAIEGYRVLMIDLDSQCNLTRTFLAPEMIQNTLANVLIDNKGDQLPFRAAIYETHIESLDLAAAHIRLARLEKSGQFDDLFRLKDALASLTEEYDFALIDCPPSLGVVVTQALLASDNVLIPVAAEYYAFEGTQDLEEAFSEPDGKTLPEVLAEADAGGWLAEGLTRLYLVEEVARRYAGRFQHLEISPATAQGVRVKGSVKIGSGGHGSVTVEGLVPLRRK